MATRYHAAGGAKPCAAVLVLAAGLLAAPEVSAQCVQAGSEVSCTGMDPDGFVATESSLTVTVQPNATVDNGGTGNAMRVLNFTDIVIEQDSGITATGEGSRAVFGSFSNTLTNRGSVIVSGSAARGVALGSSSTLVNESTGRILLSPGLQAGNNIGVDGANSASITNDGLIRVDGADGIGVAAGANGTVTNTGSIFAPGTDSIAVSLGSGSTLDNDGTIDAMGDGGVGLRFNGSRTVTTNRGTIQGGDGTGVGVFFNTTESTATQGTLVNEVGALVGSLSGVAVQGSPGADQIRNAGTLDGDVLLDAGDDTFAWAAGSTLNGDLDGGGGNDGLALFQSDPAAGVDDIFDLGTAASFESLVVGQAGDTGTWTISGSGDYANGIGVAGGTVQFSPGTTIQNVLTVEGGTARLGDGTSYTQGISVTGGTVVLESGASTQVSIPGDPAPFDVEVFEGGIVTAEGTSTLVGDLRFNALSSYRSTFDAATATRVDVQGLVVIQPNANLSLVSGDSAVVSQSYRVLSTSDGITGQFEQVVTSAFARATPRYGPTSGASFLDVLIESSFSLPATSGNESRVGQHLNSAVALGPSPEFSTFLSSLGAITDPAEGSRALDALHPEVYDAHTSASFEAGSTFSDLLAERPLRCEQFVSPQRRDPPSLEPCGEKRLAAWATGFGRYADHDGRSNAKDWSYVGGGLAFGVDHDLTPDVLLSAMLGTSRVGLDFDGEGDGSLTTFEMGVAGAWRHGNTHVRGVVEYGHGWHETHRQVDFQGFSRLALSDYESNRVTALVEASHTFVMMPFELEPIASVEYTYLLEESTKESNAGVVDLDVDSRSNVLVATRTGIRAGMTLVKYRHAGLLLEWADGVWRPEIEASWRQVLNDYDRALSSRLDGAPAGTPKFRTRTRDTEYGGDLAARVSFQPHGTRNTIDLSYEAFLGNRTTVHSLTARFRIPF